MFCRNKHMFVTKDMCLSWQCTSFVMTKVCLFHQNFCCDKMIFVMTNVFVMTKVVSQQAYFCHSKRYFCHDKHNNKSMLVMTNLLSWQNYVCCGKHLSWQKYFVVTIFFCNRSFVMTYFFCNKRCVLSWQTCVCCDKHMFATTKLLSWQKWHLWQPLLMIQINLVSSHLPFTLLEFLVESAMNNCADHACSVWCCYDSESALKSKLYCSPKGSRPGRICSSQSQIIPCSSEFLSKNHTRSQLCMCAWCVCYWECVYMCMHVCACMCMHLRDSVYVCVCMSPCVNVCACMHVCVCLYGSV